MSRVYKVPPDIKIKEKVIGGILTLGQAGWLGGGIGIGLLVFVSLFKIIGGVLSIIIAFFISLIGIPFAFYKKEQLTFYQYLKLKKSFKKKVKKLPNKRREVF